MVNYKDVEYKISIIQKKEGEKRQTASDHYINQVFNFSEDM